MKRNKPARGYTLVEMLTVIGIITILTIILMPIVAKARDSAKQAGCMSNMRQLAIAVMQYRAEHGGEGRYGDMYEMGMPATHLLVDYTSSLSVFRCLAGDEGANQKAFTYFPTPPEESTGAVSWEMYSKWAKEDTVIWSDGNHLRSDKVPSPYVTFTGFGVTISGSAVRRSAKGPPNTMQFWYDGPIP